MLHGREREKQRITALVDEAWASRGGALVVRGQPGVGKSTLLRDAVDGLDGTQILTTRGIESESPLAFAALQRLLRPVMRHADRLPEPQASALRAAFGEQTGGGDRFLVFLATLSLLAEAAEQAPVLCVIDDAHWLDDASAAALLFTARRIGPERIALLFAAREGDVRRFDSEDLPELVVGGLDPDAAEALLREQAGAPLPADVCASLLRQTGGNPLALVELPRALSADQLLGVEPLPAQLPLTEEMQRVFLDRSRHLSPDAQTLLLVASADDSTRLPVIRAALTALGANADWRWRKPRNRAWCGWKGPSSSYATRWSAPPSTRPRRVAYAGSPLGARRGAGGQRPRPPGLASRRGADEPDEAVVRELEQTAERAQARGGYEAASAALERAAELSSDQEGRARRLFAAANNAWLAGQLARARPLADAARQHTTDPVLRADLDRLRGRIEFNIGSVPAGIRMWTQAARDVARRIRFELSRSA